MSAAPTKEGVAKLRELLLAHRAQGDEESRQRDTAKTAIAAADIAQRRRANLKVEISKQLEKIGVPPVSHDSRLTWILDELATQASPLAPMWAGADGGSHG